MAHLWKMLAELKRYAERGELNDAERAYVLKLWKHLDPYHPYDELTERQVRYVHFLYDRYAMGEDVMWDEVDDLPLKELD